MLFKINLNLTKEKRKKDQQGGKKTLKDTLLLSLIRLHQTLLDLKKKSEPNECPNQEWRAAFQGSEPYQGKEFRINPQRLGNKEPQSPTQNKKANKKSKQKPKKKIYSQKFGKSSFTGKSKNY